MDALILAAGYATRLYPLTLTRAKPLLEVAGRPMIEHVLDAIAGVRGLERVLVVSNAKFANDFEAWAEQVEFPCPITVLNDGSTSPEDAKGAIGDILFTLDRAEVRGDLLIAAGDNLFSESVAGFVEEARRRNAPMTAVYDVGDLELIKKYNAIEVDADDRIVAFEEKPKEPKNTLTGIALYYYTPPALDLLRQYIAEGNNPDQPGRFVQWLYPRMPVFTWKVPGIWFDIGGKESLEEAGRTFEALAARAKGA